MKSFSQFLIENEVAESFGGYIVESEIDPLTGQIVSRRGEAAKFQSKVEKEIKNKTNKNKFVKGQTTGTQTPKRGATTIRNPQNRQYNLFTGKPEPPELVPVKTTYKQRLKKSKVSSDPTIPGINNVSDSDKVGQGLGKADPSKQLKGQSSDIKTKKESPRRIVIKRKPGDIKAEKEILKQQTPGTNTSITPSRSGEKIKTTANKVTVNVSNTRDPLTSIERGTKKTIVKPTVTTNISKPVKFKSFLDRIGQATGVKNPITKKFSPNTKVTGLSTKDLKNLKGKVRVGGILKGAGRLAGGVFAVKDAYDKAKKERIKGRSKTSQILGGIAKGAGGYLGAAVGATAGTLAGGGVGSFALGTGGAIAGYNLGSKAGDYLYKKGRQLATSKKAEAAKVKFKDFMKNIRK